MKRMIPLVMGILMTLNANAIMILGEETPGKFLRATEVLDGYKFETCRIVEDTADCKPIFNGTTFTRSELDDLSDRNARYALYAAGGDVVAVVGGFFAGLYVGVTVLAYDGAALAAASFLYGGTTGTALGTTATIALDNLDPFVHRDTSIAYEAIIGTADEGDLEDVDAFNVEGDLALVIEDITFTQLEDKFKSQLADIKGMDVEELERESLKHHAPLLY